MLVAAVLVWSSWDRDRFPGRRDPRAWPFAADSIWNLSIGADAEFADPHLFQPPNGYTVDVEPIVMAPASPLRQVYDHPWPARCHQPGDRPTGVPLPVPDGYVVHPEDGEWEGQTPNLAGGVLLPDGRTIQELNYWTRCQEGGPISVADGALRGRLDIYGDGRGSGQHSWGGHGGSMLSGVGGSIRVGELTGDEPIRHATKLTIDCTRWCRRVGEANHHRWPAFLADSADNVTYGSHARGYEPILGMGSLLAIPGPVHLDALGLETEPARKLARAWQDYGAYVVDDSSGEDGWGQNALVVEHGVRAELRSLGVDPVTYSPEGWRDTAWNRDMNRLFGQLREVANNAPDRIGGGGERRRPLAPPFESRPGQRQRTGGKG